MKHSDAKVAPVTPCATRTAAPRQLARRMTDINMEVYRWLVDMTCISNSQMSRATGMSESYVAQVRSGKRVRVNVDFVNRAALYVAARMSEPVVITRVLLTKEQ